MKLHAWLKLLDTFERICDATNQFSTELGIAGVFGSTVASVRRQRLLPSCLLETGDNVTCTLRVNQQTATSGRIKHFASIVGRCIQSIRLFTAICCSNYSSPVFSASVYVLTRRTGVDAWFA
jgi:hypothetical protein